MSELEVMRGELQAMRDQIAALTTAAAEPTLGGERIERDVRAAKIRTRIAVAVQLRNGTPEQRAAIILSNRDLQNVFGVMGLEEIIAIARDLPSPAFRRVETILGSPHPDIAGMLPAFHGALLSAAQMPKLIKVETIRNHQFQTKGLWLANDPIVMLRDDWNQLLEKEVVAEQVANGKITVGEVTEVEARAYVVRELTAKRWYVTYDGMLREAADHEHRDPNAKQDAMNARAAAARIREADAASADNEPTSMEQIKAVQENQRTAADKREAKKAALLAEAVVAAMDAREARRAKKIGK